jgi:hypothetical protein
LAISFQKYRQEGFLGRWAQRENYSWPEGRKYLDHPELNHRILLTAFPPRQEGVATGRLGVNIFSTSKLYEADSFTFQPFYLGKKFAAPILY